MIGLLLSHLPALAGTAASQPREVAPASRRVLAPSAEAAATPRNHLPALDLPLSLCLSRVAALRLPSSNHRRDTAYGESPPRRAPPRRGVRAAGPPFQLRGPDGLQRRNMQRRWSATPWLYVGAKRKAGAKVAKDLSAFSVYEMGLGAGIILV